MVQTRESNIVHLTSCKYSFPWEIDNFPLHFFRLTSLFYQPSLLFLWENSELPPFVKIWKTQPPFIKGEVPKWKPSIILWNLKMNIRNFGVVLRKVQRSSTGKLYFKAVKRKSLNVFLGSWVMILGQWFECSFSWRQVFWLI